MASKLDVLPAFSFIHTLCISSLTNHFVAHFPQPHDYPIPYPRTHSIAWIHHPIRSAKPSE
ncbi:unnamed protein product [Periconia digitata]|uniref:Uncharacterized protein n=1 Tax=Periconia digitata TaxID=1303443 RepID=A0A9W4UNP7_9PLEO|nr:unnamed protein product [Periconia digitata]